ncbi:hypothetical protein HXX76_004482 [Chlamydomonas incerta]|uniref:Uncharacterized protein n=1 Tax=Chlamydomonas incerta TaxID=51695 RepID=A0A835T7J6_CHLIN|nr:hypothetical protein HXX76_004482 [Chlamydomonas incerta]|eukprot:KAG2440377.1 hypothetical protein HXX76_004482 [Chlamydomonas incerta]
MASLNNKVLVMIAGILMLIGWVVALAGVARANDLCNKATNNQAKDSCSKGLRYDWWGVWYTFFITIACLVMAVLGKADAWVSTLQALLAACLSVTMIDTNTWVGLSDRAAGDYADAANAALAGFIIASIGITLMIIFLGLGGAGINVSVSVAASKTSPEKPAKSVETA